MTDTNTGAALQLEIFADVICPWCFIGKRRLDQALETLRAKGLDIETRWAPYQLNPTLPAEGMDRKQFRSQRFGSWENSLAMDSRAANVGRQAGVDFQYSKITRTPNTLLAHALVRAAGQLGGSRLQHGVVEAVFGAYFTDGRDIGDRNVLRAIGHDHGLSDEAIDVAFADLASVRAEDEQARKAGLNGVPSYRINGHFLASGSMDPDAYVELISRAAAVLKARTAA